MKRYFLGFIVSLISFIGYAQNTVVVHQGMSSQEFQLTEKDSITHSNDNVKIHHNSTTVSFPVSSIDSITVINSSEFEYLYITNVIDWGIINASHSGYKLLSIQQEKELAESESNVVTPVIKSETPQIMLLLNADGDIVMMSKTVFTENGQTNNIDAHSTAIALVTMHPIFPFVHGDDYETLVQIITSSRYFAPLEEEVQKIVEQGKSPLVDNGDVLMALGTLLEELTSETEENVEPLEVLRENAPRRDSRPINIANITNIGPFDMELLGDVLHIRTHFLTPLYEGSVTYPSGFEPLNIPTGPDYGIVNLLRSWFSPHGDENGNVTFDFGGHPDGEYTFNFDRTTTNAQLDFGCRLFCDILDIFGLPIARANMRDFADEICKQAMYRGLSLSGIVFSQDPYKAMEIVTGAILDVLSTPEGINCMIKQGLSTSAIAFINRLSVVLGIYQSIRGLTNTALRITTRRGSPERITYRLCRYNNITSSCKNVSLKIYSGNNQKGNKGDRLLEKLYVEIHATSDDGYDLSDELYRVKFEVVSGGGSVYPEDTYCGSNAYTSWKLGHEGTEQQVRAVVIDPATKEEISEPVFFTATALETGKVTFRLDWANTLTDTDIDLHVLCPKGHEIYYASMSCPCGGYLDRDDRNGPGPEHITFNSAIPGDYIAYVHHYDSKQKWYAGWKMTVWLDNDAKTREAYGSVWYHDYSPKYRLRVSESTSESRRQIDISEITNEDLIYPTALPKKEGE